MVMKNLKIRKIMVRGGTGIYLDDGKFTNNNQNNAHEYIRWNRN